MTVTTTTLWARAWASASSTARKHASVGRQKKMDPSNGKRKFTQEEALAVLNRKGGPVTEEEIARIDPHSLAQEDVKRLKKLRRAIRNRESATASRLRRKEYIENLEKRMSELSSQNTLLNISVTEMQMREKSKREEEERIREENDKLRADTRSTRAANMKLREENQLMQAVSEKLKAFEIVDNMNDDIVEPPTWPPPKKAPRHVVLLKN